MGPRRTGRLLLSVILCGGCLATGSAVFADGPAVTASATAAAAADMGQEALLRLQALREARLNRVNRTSAVTEIGTPQESPGRGTLSPRPEASAVPGTPALPVIPRSPAPASRAAQGSGRLRIAVLPIEAASGNSPFESGTFDAGKAITDRLLARLQGSARFDCYDRSQLAVVLREQDLGKSGRVTPETAAAVGRLTGVQYLLSGTVSEFAMIKGRGGEISVPTSFGTVKAGGRGKRVRTAVDLKLIEVETGRIVAAVRGRDEISAGDAAIGATVHGVDANYESQEFINSALGKSMDRIALNLLRQLEASPIAPPPPVEEFVCTVMGNVTGQIVLNAGRKHGVQPGMRFEISHAVEMIDPANGSPKRVSLPRGEITIVSVDEETSVGEPIAADRGMVAGDLARRK